MEFINMFDNELLNCNTTDKSLDYLTKHPEEIEWELLSSNENNKAIELLIKNPNKINSKHLSINQSIIIKKII
jgi:hypothetical protein